MAAPRPWAPADEALNRGRPPPPSAPCVAASPLANPLGRRAFARAVVETASPVSSIYPAMTRWRREVLGEAWTRWVTGKLALVVDVSVTSGLALVDSAMSISRGAVI